MRLPFTRLSNIQKFFISLTLVFAAAIIDLHLFTRKSAQVELYDGLAASVSNMRVSISRLEYLLDMFIVARRFESTTIDLIKEDVDRLGAEITGVLADRRFLPVIKGNALLSEGVDSITDEWHSIKTEVGRLNDSISQDEAMLIHNAVDIHTVLVTEKADRLIGVISENRQAIFDETRSLEFKSIVGFVLLALFVSLVYYKKVVSPVEKAARAALRISAGNREVRFNEDPRSLLGRLGRELNAMLETMARDRVALKNANSSLSERLAEEGLRVRAFSSLMSLASSSLSRNDVLNSALSEAVSGAGADAGAVFMAEDGGLRLMASYGFGSAVPGELAQPSAAVLEGAGDAEGGRVFKDIREFPDSSLRELLLARGFESLLCAPISYNRETLGCFIAAFKGDMGDAEAKLPFVEALARGAAVSIGHAGLFQGEHNARRFAERVINQLPFGVAVFDGNGSCRLWNAALRKILGAEKADLSGNGLLEDEALASKGVLASVKRAYEGYSTELVIDYNPAEVKSYSGSGPHKRLKVKSFPLYDAGGDISNIVVLYEELPHAPGEPAGTGDAL